MGLFKPQSSVSRVVTPSPTPQTVGDLVATNITSDGEFMFVTLEGNLTSSFLLRKITTINSSGSVLQLFSGDILTGQLTFTTRGEAVTAFNTIQSAINALTA